MIGSVPPDSYPPRTLSLRRRSLESALAATSFDSRGGSNRLGSHRQPTRTKAAHGSDVPCCGPFGVGFCLVFQPLCKWVEQRKQGQTTIGWDSVRDDEINGVDRGQRLCSPRQVVAHTPSVLPSRRVPNIAPALQRRHPLLASSLSQAHVSHFHTSQGTCFNSRWVT